MAIDCVVIQWADTENKDYTDSSAYSVINWNYQPESLPVVGLQEDLEVLVKRTPNIEPDYDSRLYVLNINQAASEDFDEEYTTNRMFVKTYSLVEQTTESKEDSINEAELNANLAIFPTKKQLKYLLLYTALTRREALGYTISDEQQAILDKGDSIASKFWLNHIENESKKNSLNNGEEIDLDDNWETSE